VTAIALLFITGVLLLAAEVFLPGAIAGIMGGAALLLGSILAYSNFGAGVGTLASLGALLLVGIALYVELIWLPKTKFGQRLVVGATIDSQSQPPPAIAAEVVGKTATALTTLAPSGFVSIDGKRYEAACRSGLVARGATLTVVGVDNFRLIVSEPIKTP
jgi:membrane-bound ClpP family serine protease